MARGHFELFPVGRVVDGSDGPGHADAQEDAHRVAACDVTYGRIPHTGPVAATLLANVSEEEEEKTMTD